MCAADGFFTAASDGMPLPTTDRGMTTEKAEPSHANGEPHGLAAS